MSFTFRVDTFALCKVHLTAFAVLIASCGPRVCHLVYSLSASLISEQASLSVLNVGRKKTILS